LAVDANGVLYGTTLQGGAGNVGTVFRLAPPQPGATRWTRQTLHVFRDSPDGKYPLGGVTLTADGSLVGAAFSGGAGLGTIYKLTPPAAGATRWTYQTIYNFDPKGLDHAPLAPVLALSGGAVLVGSKAVPGGCGAIFRLQPPKPGATAWKRQDLASAATLGKCEDFGRSAPIPYGRGEFVAVSDGGTIYRVTPPATAGQPWKTAPLAGAHFSQTVLCCRDASGRIFGISMGDGVKGAVVAFTPPTDPAGTWTSSILRVLSGILVDGMPHALVRVGKSLYGVARMSPDGAGMLYRLDPPTSPNGSWTKTKLVDFGRGAAIGIDPANLTLGPGGILYGTTIAGSNGNGTVFRVVP
jgi:uncharacterized repeat protein (TIGR03803 family)